jgi:hypothetical protein
VTTFRRKTRVPTRLVRINPLKLPLSNFAEARTLEQLRKEQAEIARKLCDERHTDRELRGLSKESKVLSDAIRDKEILHGFRNGSLHIVSEYIQGQWRLSVGPPSGRRKEKRRAKAFLRRSIRAHLLKLNFDGTRGEIRAKSEDAKV